MYAATLTEHDDSYSVLDHSEFFMISSIDCITPIINCSVTLCNWYVVLYL